MRARFCILFITQSVVPGSVMAHSRCSITVYELKNEQIHVHTLITEYGGSLGKHQAV